METPSLSFQSFQTQPTNPLANGAVRFVEQPSQLKRSPTQALSQEVANCMTAFSTNLNSDNWLHWQALDSLTTKMASNILQSLEKRINRTLHDPWSSKGIADYRIKRARRVVWEDPCCAESNGCCLLNPLFPLQLLFGGISLLCCGNTECGAPDQGGFSLAWPSGRCTSRLEAPGASLATLPWTLAKDPQTEEDVLRAILIEQSEYRHLIPDEKTKAKLVRAVHCLVQRKLEPMIKEFQQGIKEAKVTIVIEPVYPKEVGITPAIANLFCLHRCVPRDGRFGPLGFSASWKIELAEQAQKPTALTMESL